MPAGRKLVRLYVAVVVPLIALGVVTGGGNGLLEVAANDYLSLGLPGLAVDLVARQLDQDLLLSWLAGTAAFAAVALLLWAGPRAARLTPYPLAAAVCVLVVRALYLPNLSLLRVHGDAIVLDALTDGATRRGAGIVAAVHVTLATGVVLLLWRRRADVAAFLGSQGLRRTAVALAGAAGIAAVAANGARLALPLPAAPNPVNVIYLTWDSTRADHLSCYGYDRPTSPNLDRFAADAVRYARAMSQHNWTRPSYASIFTGLPNWQLPNRRLGRSSLTIAEVLRSRGYRTVGFVQGANLDAELSYDQGFDTYVHLKPGSSSELMNRFVLERLPELAAEKRPFYLFVHYHGPHWPYPRDNRFLDEFVRRDPVPPGTVRELMKYNGRDWDPEAEGAGEIVSSMLELYDSEVRLTDEAFGEVMAALKRLGLYEDSLILFNSDHGDEFNERGAFGHAHANVHPELTFVPLIVRFPGSMGVPASVVGTLAQNLDILPTVTEVTGIGWSWSPLPGLPLGTDPDRAPPAQVVYSNRGALVALRRADHSLLVDWEKGSIVGLYDAAGDLDEVRPLPDFEGSAAFGELIAMAEDWYDRYRVTGGSGDDEPTEMSKELREQLRALGYAN